MKKLILLLLVSFTVSGFAQNSYKSLVDKASEVSADTKDASKLSQALKLYRSAFQRFPKEAEAESVLDAASLAAKLGKKDEAFSLLDKFLAFETDADGTPTWRYLSDKSISKEFKNITGDGRWEKALQKSASAKADFLSRNAVKEAEFFKNSQKPLDKSLPAEKIYGEIKNYGGYLPKSERNYSITLKISDTAKTAYLVHLPENYNPQKRYPVLIYLHGAVRHTQLSDFQVAQQNLGEWNRFYTKYGDRDGVILVFPQASKEYNWMLGNAGFFMVPEIVRQLKTALNVDDDRVFLTGHSNGATGSFNYLVKEPTLFAGFFGMNTQPKVYTGGTFIENVLNRSFTNFSTDLDYYFPPNANDDLDKMMKSLNADYTDHRFNGFTHGFPMYDKSEPAFQMIFEEMARRKRNPFPKKISWEFDDNRYGTVDWLTDAVLDTLKPREGWHKNENFKITKELDFDKNDSLREVIVDKYAFAFPRKSGKVVAEFSDNVFNVKTSDIAGFTLLVSPEMVDLKKNVKVIINGRQVFNKKVDFDKAFMIENFEKSRDRSQVWVNRIPIKTAG